MATLALPAKLSGRSLNTNRQIEAVVKAVVFSSKGRVCFCVLQPTPVSSAPDGGDRHQPLESLHSLKTGEHLLRSGGEWKNEWKTVTKGVLIGPFISLFCAVTFPRND